MFWQIITEVAGKAFREIIEAKKGYHGWDDVKAHLEKKGYDPLKTRLEGYTNGNDRNHQLFNSGWGWFSGNTGRPWDH